MFGQHAQLRAEVLRPGCLKWINDACYGGSFSLPSRVIINFCIMEVTHILKGKYSGVPIFDVFVEVLIPL